MRRSGLTILPIVLRPLQVELSAEFVILIVAVTFMPTALSGSHG